MRFLTKKQIKIIVFITPIVSPRVAMVKDKLITP